VYWFNPLYWLVCRRLKSESEHACDDVVLNTGFDAKDYAAQLLDLARNLKNSDRAWSAVLAMSRPPHLERRFIAMLNPSLNHRSLTRTTALAISLIAICVTLPLAAAMRAPAAQSQTVSSPSVAVIARAPAAKEPIAVASRPMAKPSPRSKPTPAPVPQGRADGTLSGTVSDGSGAVVPGVIVTVSALEAVAGFGSRENPVATTKTNDVGVFEFRGLTPGPYSLKAELPGFATYRRSGIQITSSQTTREKVFLSVGNIAQRVEVSVQGQPKPPVPSTAPQRVRVGGYVVAANLISQVKPAYPQSVRDSGIEGTVHLQGIIGTDGNFVTLRVVRSNDRDLASAAFEAVKQWRYKPTLLNGEPIEVLTEIDVEFKLAQ
jgi:TonB family protein